MAKWADYGISAVRFNEAHTHIDSVRVHLDNGETIGSGIEWARSKVVAAIERGTTFVTILENREGNWTKGQPVYPVVIHGVKYIKTTRDETTKDNLDELPEF